MRYALIWSTFAAGAVLCSGCSSSSGDGTPSSGCENLVPAANSEFCEASPATPDCTRINDSYKVDVCGVPLKQPPGELQRSENVEEFPGSGPPDVSCYLPDSYPATGTSTTVTVQGITKIFSHGCMSKSVTIEVYRVVRDGSANDGALGALIGTPVTTEADCTTTGVATPDEDTCGTVFECKYEYPGVPTETELVFKTYSTSSPVLWAPIYEYNVYAFESDEGVATGTWTHDVRALAQDDYGVIAQAAIGNPVTQTHGVLAGEVHDCGNVRLINATVDIDTDKVATTYFTNDEAHPLPDRTALGTSTLGLYSALDIKPGPVTVAASGLVGGELVSVGFFRARIFEDSVTSVTFRGLRPFQVP
jgi:hypothetical protein